MGGGGQPAGGGHPTGGPRPPAGVGPAGGGHPQGTPRPGPTGVAGQADSNHNPAKVDGRAADGHHSETNHRQGDGRGDDHRDRGRNDRGDHDRDRDHGHHGHGDHDGDRDRDRDFRGGFYYYDPFWGWGYPYDSYYLYPEYDYSYPDYSHSEPATSSPSRTEIGGVSFAVTPADALVYVDDNYVGIASDFSGGSQPLSLAAGTHRIELQATGYEPIASQVNVVAGQVLPYQVDLRPKSDR